MALVQIHRFWTIYEIDGETTKADDWVEYGPRGESDRTRTREKIARMSKLQPDDGANEVVKMAHAIWNDIKPHYDAWKAGQEIPETGTPLAAWSGVSPEQAEFLRTRGIRTVEDLADLTDTHISRMPLPNLREIIRTAKRFLEGADARVSASKITAVEEENANLKAELAEIRQMLMREAADAPAKRGPGRPRKEAAPADDDEAEAA
jgi:predicted flap endonuclease-1-like 5' DNA nuclease